MLAVREINMTAPSPTKAPRTLTRKITTGLALLLMLALWLGIGTYGFVHPTEGLARVFGQAIIPLLIAGVIAWSQRKSKRPFAWDIGLAVTAVFLIWVNREHLLSMYDLSRFQSEIRSSSNPEQTLAISETQLAQMTRGALSITQETGNKIASILKGTEDPILETALSPETLSNQDALRQAQEVVEAKLVLAQTAMLRIEIALQNEVQQIEKFGEGFSRDISRNFLEGSKKRHDRHRALYQRQAMLNTAFLEEMKEMLSLLSSRFGSYQIAETSVVFQSDADAQLYNSYVTKFQSLVAQQQKLDQDMREEVEMSTKAFDRLLSGTQ